jgi:hypothetical protein
MVSRCRSRRLRFFAAFGLCAIAIRCFNPLLASAQQSYRTQQSLHSRSAVGSRAKQSQSDTASRIPGHPAPFRGWRRAAQDGPDAVRHFLRLAHPQSPYSAARAAHSFTVATSAKASGVTTRATAGTAARDGSLSSSEAALPGILLRPSLPAGALPSGVVTGDFNGDGLIDWAVSNAGDNSVTVYLGRGNGTSELPLIIALSGQSPVGITVADLNGDQKLDLIVAEADSNTVGILYGNGDGTFQSEVEIPIANAQPLGVTVADVNKDGHPDLVVAAAGDGTHVNSNFGVLLGDGAGHFGLPIYAPNPQTDDLVAGTLVSVADANGDGIPDVLVTGVNPEGTTLQTFFGKGDGTFTGGTIVWESLPTPTFQTDIGQSFFADVNGDGCPDIVLGESNGSVLVFFNDCMGNFPSLPSGAYGVGDAAFGLAIADINSDGHPDIVAAGVPIGLGNDSPIGYSTGNTLTVLFNDGTGKFGAPQIYRGDPGMFAVAAADLHGNGRPDIISANQNTNSITIYPNNGSGGFGQPMGGYDGFVRGTRTSPPNNAPDSAVVVADADGDGKPDLALLELPEPGSFNNMVTLAVMLNQGAGEFSTPIRTPVISANPPLSVGDFVLADFRNSGRPDFLAEVFNDAATTSPQLIYAQNTGNGQFGTPTTISFPTQGTYGFGAIAVGDFNKDGKLDFAVATSTGANGSSQQLTIYLGHGDGTFTQSFQTSFGASSASLYSTAVFVGDANSDGKLDLFVSLSTNVFPDSGDDLFEFLGNGDGTFQPSRDVLQRVGPMTMVDLNNDGILDVISLSGSLNAITPGIETAVARVYLGQPDGSFGIPVTYSPYSGFLDNRHGDNVTMDSGYSLDPYVGDFNGDGKIDLAIFQQTSLDDAPAYVQFLEGNGDGTFTPTSDIFPLGIPMVPDFTALNLLGDGRVSFVQTPNFTSTYQIIPAANAPVFQIAPAEIPVIGGNDALEIILDLPSPADTPLALSASDPNVLLPASVTVPAGQTLLEVPFRLSNSIPANHWFSITAQLGNSTQTTFDSPGRPGLDSFQIDVVPPPLHTVQQGGLSESWSAGVQSNGDASGTFQISCSGLPKDSTCVFQDISTVIIPGNGFENVIFTVNAAIDTPVGSFAFTVIATDGVTTLTSSQTIQVTAAPPALSVMPISLTFGPTLDGAASPPQSLTVSNNSSTSVSPFVIGLLGDSQPAIGTFHQVMTTCVNNLAANSSCIVQVAFSAAQPGTDTSQFSFSGSAGTVLIPLTGTAADFAFQLPSGSSSSTTITVGQSAVFNLQIAPTLLQGAVNLSCSGAPPLGQCMLPASVNVGNGLSAPFQVTVSTATTGAVTPGHQLNRRSPSVSGTLAFAVACLGVIMLALRGRQTSGLCTVQVLLFLLTFIGLLALPSCGGSGGSGGGGGGGGGGGSGTLPGSYAVTVTGAAGNGSRSIQLTVNVVAK